MFETQKSVARVINAARSQSPARRPYQPTTGSRIRLWAKLEYALISHCSSPSPGEIASHPSRSGLMK
jgi:hypothetical protein